MKAQVYFHQIEKRIPLGLSLAGDPSGFTGPGDPRDLDIKNVLVMMDYVPDAKNGPDLRAADLLVLHHPPVEKPEIPTYVIHSNWDRLIGGACDALADCLLIDTTEVLDEETGLGRVGRLRDGPVPLVRFAWDVAGKLRNPDIRIVNFQQDLPIERVAVVSGFGLNPGFIRKAYDKGAGLYLSGDLTHPGAILAQHLGLVLVDVPHHATEMPGLYRLAKLLSGIGPAVRVRDTGVPWRTFSKDRFLKNIPPRS
jgi:dinuclear metal center YbgI/SA1388 family protein